MEENIISKLRRKKIVGGFRKMCLEKELAEVLKKTGYMWCSSGH